MSQTSNNARTVCTSDLPRFPVHEDQLCLLGEGSDEHDEELAVSCTTTCKAGVTCTSMKQRIREDANQRKLR